MTVAGITTVTQQLQDTFTLTALILWNLLSPGSGRPMHPSLHSFFGQGLSGSFTTPLVVVLLLLCWLQHRLVGSHGSVLSASAHLSGPHRGWRGGDWKEDLTKGRGGLVKWGGLEIVVQHRASPWEKKIFCRECKFCSVLLSYSHQLRLHVIKKKKIS